MTAPSSQNPSSVAQTGSNRLPIEQWDSEILLKAHLKRNPEPTTSRTIDHTQTIIRARFLKLRIRDLEVIKASIDRPSYDVESEIAAARFKRKILLWLIFPINTLPEEILVLIFRQVLFSSDDAALATTHRLHLTWVCRPWRNIAINDKTMWSTIWFRDRPPYTRSLAWLARAGTAPLDIRINEILRRHQDDNPPRLTEAEVSAVLDEIVKYSPTIRSFVAVLDTWDTSLTVLRKFNLAEAPLNIERFELHRLGSPYMWTTPGREPFEVTNPISLFNGIAPRLQSLTINGLNIDWTTSPVMNLTMLDLRRMAMAVCPSVERWREMLMGCPNLYRLHLDASGPRWGDDCVHYPPVELKSLRDLLLGDFSVGYASFVLLHFTAPNLASLGLMNMSGADFAPFIRLLVGRFPALKILSVYTVVVFAVPQNTALLVKWLDSMPHLQFLKIAQVMDNFLDAFLEDPLPYRPLKDVDTESDGDPPRAVLCPELRYLHFHFQPVSSIVKFAQRRRELGVPLLKAYTPANSDSPLRPSPDEDKLLKESIQEVVYNRNLIYTEEERHIHLIEAAATNFQVHLLFQD